MTAVLNPNQGGDLSSIIDINDPEYIRQILRPAVVKEDVNLMEKRRRVTLILRSPAFRKELEKIVASQMREGELSPNVMALKQLVDIFTPHAKLGSSTFSKSATVPVIPVNDLQNQQHGAYSKPEKIMRCKLASTYRLVDILGWCSGTACHISARVFKDGETYLFNPQGLLFNEITASSLIKLDLKGTIMDGGSNSLGVDKQGWMLHAAIHEALPSIRCIIQLSTPATIAVSCMKSGLLPITQEAMMLGAVATYDPSALRPQTTTADGDRRTLAAAEESAAIRQCLLDVNGGEGEPPRLLLIKKYGLLALGQSVEEAWTAAYLATSACESQLRLACLGDDELILPPTDMASHAFADARSQAHTQLLLSPQTGVNTNWRPGELEFEAMMRRLDAAGYRTGHIYRIGQVLRPQTRRAGRQSGAAIPEEEEERGDKVDSVAVRHARRAASLGRGLAGLREEIEVPPAASSFVANFYTDEATRLKSAAEYRLKTMSLSRTHWHTTPNAYKREEIEEVGTANPKTIMHWTEGGKKTTGGTVLATEDINQFAPQGDNPQELRHNQQKVRSKYYNDVRNAGPQSKILDGLDLDDGDMVDFSGTASPKLMSPRGTLLRLDPANPPTLEPGHVVIVGAVSKGIINRDQRHNVGLFQSVFSPNPFDQVTDDELDRYKRNVERKQKGMMTEEEEEEMLESQRLSAASPVDGDKHRSMPMKSLEVGHEEIKSDTSVGEFSAGEASKSADGTKERKKRRFKLPSFSRKGKDKKNKTADTSKQ